ncbi:uncharacterized protein [Dysidea avara]|uniref:uncharacterized protein n=1 Tax=Dysidea avara TaxID=196820 RepID=UPI003317B1E7
MGTSQSAPRICCILVAIKLAPRNLFSSIFRCHRIISERFQKHFSPGATTRDHYCGFVCCRIESVVVLIKAVQFDYLPKELSKYKKINWLSWKAWLWPRKLKPSNGVILEESTSRISGRVQRVQESRRGTAPSMTTSVFVTPRTSPPHSPSVQRFDVVPEESEEIEAATLSALDHSYIQQGVESLAVTEDLLSSLDGWKLERQEVGSCATADL